MFKVSRLYEKKSYLRVPAGVPSIMLGFGDTATNKTAPAVMELTSQWEEKIKEVLTVKFRA